MRAFHAGISLFCFLAMASCEDFRKDQREENLFNTSNAFIRFDFGNTVNGIAKDSVVLKRTVLDTINIPVALSSAPLQTDVSVRMVASALAGSMKEGTDYELRNNSATLPPDKLLRIPPGQFVQYLTFAERAPAPTGKQRIRLELIEVSPSSIHLGFPGSSRGKYFDLIYTD